MVLARLRRTLARVLPPPASARPLRRTTRPAGPAPAPGSAGSPAMTGAPANAGVRVPTGAPVPVRGLPDFTGPLPPITYSPKPNAAPDPGEIVWAPVHYQEDPTRSKDRPVLLIGRDGPWLLALPLTSKDHDRDAAREASEGRYWVDIGAGAWDRRRRPSEAGLHRILRLDPRTIRREGAVLDEPIYADVVHALLARHSH